VAELGLSAYRLSVAWPRVQPATCGPVTTPSPPVSICAASSSNRCSTTSSEGYAQRFGIVHVDFATQRRDPKDSARWLGDVVRSNTLDAGLLSPPGSRPAP
jgi:beta-glucosidase/6-phospho-beta-glucosidase/beta-galactosidase